MDISEMETVLIWHISMKCGNGCQSPAMSDGKEWQECDECDKNT